MLWRKDTSLELQKNFADAVSAAFIFIFFSHSGKCGESCQLMTQKSSGLRSLGMYSVSNNTEYSYLIVNNRPYSTMYCQKPMIYLQVQKLVNKIFWKKSPTGVPVFVPSTTFSVLYDLIFIHSISSQHIYIYYINIYIFIYLQKGYQPWNLHFHLRSNKTYRSLQIP